MKLTPASDGTATTFDRPCLVLVEGRDDQAVIAKQIERLSHPDHWQIHGMGGNRTGWGSALDVVLETDFGEAGRAIALVQDADADAKGTFTRLAGLFGARKLPSPTQAGLVASDARWATGVFVVPGEETSGAVEDLLLKTIDRQRRDLAEEYIAKVSRELASPRHPSKNTLLAYIAGHVEHVRSLPVALEKTDFFPPEHPAFSPLLSFLRGLEKALQD